MDLIATPTAPNLANNPVQTPGPATPVGSASPSDSGSKQKPQKAGTVARKSSANPQKKSSVKAAKSHSGSGSNLVDAPDVEWEWNSSGGLEAWHVPPGATSRKDKTYIGYAKQKLLAEWGSLDPEARQKAVEDWVAAKRAKKGIQYKGSPS